MTMTNNTPDYNDNLYFEKKMDCKNCPFTDEYCASGECTSQSPRNGSQKGDLTSQWKKGELNRNKIYYYETPFNTADTASGYWLCNHCDTEKDKIEILGEVPSYDELQNMNEAVNQAIAANIKLVDDNKRLKHDVGNLGYKIKNQRKEIERQIAQNAQLKDLLKECRPYIALYTENNKHIGFTPETANLLQQIKEVLNEKV